ncbi:hypothetical protein GJ688_16325 [Heliobacillus mobilis]|uniref:UvrD-like helicase ATP-binding domain-containing protein n=1 Tax=Heliobacterium mobile TaxID=28064 RepID=A0A6I3SQ05_HELMO|nr:ATP-binding domain-containing protein [Heliobacterium mobile]MTV50512.1 hypothetical protein [Heliobacterium mobile]
MPKAERKQGKKTSPFIEEQTRLSKVQSELQKIIKQHGAEIEKLKIMDNPYDETTNRWLRKKDQDHLSLQQFVERLSQSPYLMRADFLEDGHNTKLIVYVTEQDLRTRESLEKTLMSFDQNPLIQFQLTSWHSPFAAAIRSQAGIGRIRYYNNLGKPISGCTSLKRRIRIEKGMLLEVHNLSRSESGDSFLNEVLRSNTYPHARKIIATVQAEQMKIISAPFGRSILLQGTVGSGKTAVLLHRLAYLYLNNQLALEQTLVISPTRLLSQYMAGINVPGFTPSKIQWATYEDFVLSVTELAVVLMEDHYEILSTDIPHPQILTHWINHSITTSRVKGSLEFGERIAAFLVAYTHKEYVTYVRDIVFPTYRGIFMLTREEQLRLWEEQIPTQPFTHRIKKIQEFIHKRFSSFVLTGNPLEEDEQKATEAIDEFHKRWHPYLDGFPRPSPIRVYMDFLISLIGQEYLHQPVSDWGLTIDLLKAGKIRREDLAPICYIHLWLNGSHRTFQHIAIDEVQDMNPLELQTLSLCMNKPRFTLVGDPAQNTVPHRGLGNVWHGLCDLPFFGEKKALFFSLTTNYRSTQEITTLANQVLPENTQKSNPFPRSGLAPMYQKAETFEQAIITAHRTIRTWLTHKQHFWIAIITGSIRESRQVYAELQHQPNGVNTYTFASSQTSERNTPCLIIDSYQAKGLELDAVIAWDVSSTNYKDTDEDRKRLHFVFTRALHELMIVHIGPPSPLVPASLSSSLGSSVPPEVIPAVKEKLNPVALQVNIFEHLRQLLQQKLTQQKITLKLPPAGTHSTSYQISTNTSGVYFEWSFQQREKALTVGIHLECKDRSRNEHYCQIITRRYGSSLEKKAGTKLERTKYSGYIQLFFKRKSDEFISPDEFHLWAVETMAYICLKFYRGITVENV